MNSLKLYCFVWCVFVFVFCSFALFLLLFKEIFNFNFAVEIARSEYVDIASDRQPPKAEWTWTRVKEIQISRPTSWRWFLASACSLTVNIYGKCERYAQHPCKGRMNLKSSKGSFKFPAPLHRDQSFPTGYVIPSTLLATVQKIPLRLMRTGHFQTFAFIGCTSLHNQRLIKTRITIKNYW